MKSSTVIFYAKMEDGCILESTNLKSLYQCVRFEVRSSFGHSLFYDSGSATIYEGVRVDWEENGKNYFTHLPMREIVTLSCSSNDRVTTFTVSKEV